MSEQHPDIVQESVLDEDEHAEQRFAALTPCDCWCHADPQPDYDSWRDYFDSHSPECNECEDEAL